MPIVMKGGPGQSRGFTLVEMSIVLVIIGLIIGGILKGQEIIASARQKAVINQVNAVRAAANTYFDRYRALPGDDTAGGSADTNIRNGDGNGQILGSVALPTSNSELGLNDANLSEPYQFFNALIATNLLNGGQVTSNSVTSGTSFGHTALPAAPISGAGMTVIYGTATGVGTGARDKTGHWIRVHKKTSGGLSALSPRTMANIDTQVDDGLAGNGGVRGIEGTGATANTCMTTGGNYAAGDDVTCIGLFEQ